MVSPLSKGRVALWSVLLIAGVVGLGMAIRPEPPVVAPECEPLPTNLKLLGNALSRKTLASTFAAGALDPKLAMAGGMPGTAIHSFQTSVTGGYVALRGACVVAWKVNWIR